MVTSKLSQQDTQDAPDVVLDADAPQADIDTLASPRDDEALAPLGGGGRVQQGIRDLVRARLFNKAPTEQRIGRYIVLNRIGRGGMGMVFAAYDEELDRKVAIKILDARGSVGDVATLRLKREAQAMARLSHPNVATVHEVGDADGEVYVAMEFIRGQSLDQWIATERPWREVLDVFVQAGQGLAAAHSAGIIHRDLKPHNIMRADGGAVKVLDFGLARTEGEDSRGEGFDSECSDDSSLAVDLTRTGAVLGTPAYMAPEQHVGDVADARSDQFSFCVALYEALYGQLPFESTTLATLVHNVRSHRLRPPPSGSVVPLWVFRIVVRGLSLEASDRWPSVSALVEALERDPARRRRRRLTAAGAVTLAGLLGFGLAELRASRMEACLEAEAHLDTLWPAARRQRVTDAFMATKSPLAVDTQARVTEQIDAHAAAWARMRSEACSAHREGLQSDRLFDRRTACLEARRAGVDALLIAFEGADASTVENATWAVASLPSISLCGDTEALTAAVPPPTDLRTAKAVQAQREDLASVASLSLMGSYDEAVDEARVVLDEATRLSYDPLVAEAQLRLGAVLIDANQHQSAHDALSRAVMVGLQSGHDEVVVEALARRMWVTAEPLRRPAQGLWDGSIADALIEKIGHPTKLSWLLLNNRGAALFRGGYFKEAERSYREALDVIATVGERESRVELISTRTNLAMLLLAGLGQPGAAAKEFRAVRTLAIEFLGPGHPRVSGYWHFIGESLIVAGRHGEAIATLSEGISALDPSARYLRGLNLVELAHVYAFLRRDAEALEAVTAVLELGSEAFAGDYLISAALRYRGIARIGLGQMPAGIADLRRAIDLEQKRSGPEHEFVANARWWAGEGLLRAGRLDEAIDELERAHDIFAGLGPSASAYLGHQSYLLIEAYLERGDLFAAEALIADTLGAQDEAGFPSASEHRAMVEMQRANLSAERGDPVSALIDYEKACGYFARSHEADDPLLARCRFAQAKALGRTREAQTLAQDALDAYRRLGEGFAPERAEVEGFLGVSG